MKLRILVLLLVVLAMCAACRRGVPVYNPTVELGATVGTSNQEDVRRAILTACAGRGWTAREAAPGRIEAKLVVRGKHTVFVDIPYSASSYAITYKTSTNMEHATKNDGVEVIHPNYNKWVQLLEQDINRNLTLSHR